MIRGTTPTHVFEIPLDASLVADLRVSYAQGGDALITKKLADVKLEGNTITVRLTEEETLLFDHSKSIAFVQVKVKTTGGDVLSSRIMNFNVFEALNEEVLA
jgi:hypothetical protein